MAAISCRRTFLLYCKRNFEQKRTFSNRSILTRCLKNNKVAVAGFSTACFLSLSAYYAKRSGILQVLHASGEVCYSYPLFIITINGLLIFKLNIDKYFHALFDQFGKIIVLYY